MSNEYESMAKLFMSSPQGSKIIKALDKINAISASDSGRQLLAILAGGGSDALKVAAQVSLNEKDPARTFLSSLLSSKEGTALAKKIIEIAGTV